MDTSIKLKNLKGNVVPRGEETLLEMDERKLLRDRRIQLLMGLLLGGGSRNITPILDPERGYRYPDAERILGEEAERLLERLETIGLLRKELCGLLAICPRCGSTRIRRSDGAWRCLKCNTLEEDVEYKPLYCFQPNLERVRSLSDQLILPRVLEFLRERGYRTESPGELVGESGVKHSFDVVARGLRDDPPIIVIDVALTDGLVEEAKVKEMFAKVYDVTPYKAVLIAVPGLGEEAKKLANRYGIDAIEARELKSLLRELLRTIPPVEEAEYRTLDVMSLLSLPDHLRKTATVLCSLGEATAEKVAERTGRARAVESSYLNQLVRMGYLKKERRGRRVLFSIVS